MSKLKIAVISLLAILLIVVVAQNTAAVETRFLFATIAMPRAVLLLLTMLVGFVIGLLTASTLGAKKAP